MPALDDFYRSYSFGQNIGQNVRASQDRREQEEYQNRLAQPLMDQDYGGAANVAFESGKIDEGLQFQDAARKLAQADREAAMAENEEFRTGYGAVVDILGRIDAAKARGIISTPEEEQAALESGLTAVAPMVQGNQKLQEAIPNLLSVYQQSPTGAAAIYSEEYMKQELEASDPAQLRKEGREDTRLGFERRRVELAEREAERKANEKEETGGLTDYQIIQVAKSYGSDFEQAAKGAMQIVRDPKINNVMEKDAEQIVDNPTLTGQLRYALARLANGGGVLSVQDVTMADGSSLYDNIISQANQLKGRGKMSERQAQRGLELLKTNYEAETQYINNLIETQQEQAGIAGVPDKYMGLVTPGSSALQRRMQETQTGDDVFSQADAILEGL